MNGNGQAFLWPNGFGMKRFLLFFNKSLVPIQIHPNFYGKIHLHPNAFLRTPAPFKIFLDMTRMQTHHREAFLGMCSHNIHHTFYGMLVYIGNKKYAVRFPQKHVKSWLLGPRKTYYRTNGCVYLFKIMTQIYTFWRRHHI